MCSCVCLADPFHEARNVADRLLPLRLLPPQMLAKAKDLCAQSIHLLAVARPERRELLCVLALQRFPVSAGVRASP